MRFVVDCFEYWRCKSSEVKRVTVGLVLLIDLRLLGFLGAWAIFFLNTDHFYVPFFRSLSLYVLLLACLLACGRGLFVRLSWFFLTYF